MVKYPLHLKGQNMTTVLFIVVIYYNIHYTLIDLYYISICEFNDINSHFVHFLAIYSYEENVDAA